jgi:hypothetical protein
VLDDLNPDLVNYNTTYGSGGGAPGAGMGGGRIILKATGTVHVLGRGVITADGSAATVPTLGAGSGGSITISATQCVVKGYISVVGGDSSGVLATAGGAGGGGRISIIVSSNATATLVCFA